MNSGAPGTIGTKGLVGVAEVTDAVVKATSVSLVEYEEIGSGLVTTMVHDDVGVIKTATDAGAVAARQVGEVVSIHMVPRPYSDTEKIIPIMASK